MGEKAAFIESVQTALEKDDKTSISHIGRLHGIKPVTANVIWNNRNRIMDRAAALGQSSKILARDTKRPMEAVEDALY